MQETRRMTKEGDKFVCTIDSHFEPMAVRGVVAEYVFRGGLFHPKFDGYYTLGGHPFPVKQLHYFKLIGE